MSACPRFGCTVQMEAAPGVAPGRLATAFLGFLATRGLEDVGGGAPESLEFLVASEGGQATELDREAILAWVGAHAEVADYGVGPLVDLERTAEA